MLKTMIALNGSAGAEEAVADYIVKYAKPYADKIFKDHFGNVYVLKKGTVGKKTVMLCAHTDEVGLIVSSVTKDGYLKFRTVGGMDAGVLPAKSVLVGASEIPGVIGGRVAHLESEEQRKKKATVEELFIDIGASNDTEALQYVAPGDRAYFKAFRYETENGFLFGKAFDDRAGCVILMELMKESYAHDVYYVFTTQEETGLRGAKIASRRIDADACIVVENTTCLDMPAVPQEKRATQLEKGPALTIADGASFADVTLRSVLQGCATELGIPFQFKNLVAGGNDAGAISANGKKVAAISVPCRYLHTPVGVISKRDFQNTIALLNAYLKGDTVC